MKHVHLTLGYLREQRSKLDTAIALLETLVGHNGRNGHDATLKVAAEALAQHEAFTPDTARRGRGRPAPGRGTGLHTNEAKRAQRERSLALLEQFDRTAPRQPENADLRGLMPLMRHGYLKRKGDGYVRTAKVFIP